MEAVIYEFSGSSIVCVIFDKFAKKETINKEESSCSRKKKEKLAISIAFMPNL